MASNEDSDVVSARVREHALKVIRDEYPYMKEAALQDIANSLQATTRKQIVAQKPLMASSKARISFFSLSSELRNKIYELALDIDDQNPNEIVVAHWRPRERQAGP